MFQTLSKTISHFKALSREAQLLLFSFVIDALLNPVVGTYTLSYTTRITGNTGLMSAFSALLSAGIIVGFVFNSYLFRLINPGGLYFFWLAISYLLSITFFTIGHLANGGMMIVLAFVFGIAWGCYWTSRHFLITRYVSIEDRSYFVGIEMSTGIILSVVLPLIYGIWLSVGIDNLSLSAQSTYLSLYLLIIPLAVVAFYNCFKKGGLKGDPVKRSEIKASFQWQLFLFAIMILGISSFGMLYAMPQLIITYVGKEFELGSYRSLSALLAAILITFIASKKLKEKQLIKLAVGFSVVTFILTIFFVLSPGKVTAIIFIIAMAFAVPVCWNCIGVTGSNLASKLGKDEGAVLSYLCQREIYLGYGRLLGFVIMGTIFVASTKALVIVITISQLLSVILLWLYRERLCE